MDLFTFSAPPWEIMLRGSLMYWFLFLIFRFLLRRDVGNMGIGDFLFIVIVADASQNAMSAESATIVDGMLLVATLVFWNLLIDYLSYRFQWARLLAVAPSMILVKDGKYHWRNMRREFITKEELQAKLREEGVLELSKVKEMRLEADGGISVIKEEEKK